MGHQFSSTIPTRRQDNKYEKSNVMIRVKVCDFVVKNSSTNFHYTKFTMFKARPSCHDVHSRGVSYVMI